MTSNDIKTCIYCGQAKASKSFSDEHIWPAKLGGNLMEGHFRTRRVCRDCNSKCGLFVDGAFIRSYLHKNALAYESLRYANFNAGAAPILPLVYFGRSRTIDPSIFGDYSRCEVWLSPCRSRVLHFHSNDSQKFTAQAGGNPITQKKAPGTAIFIPASRSLPWLSAGLASFAQHFSGTTRYVAFVQLTESDHLRIGGPPPRNFCDALVALGRDGHLDVVDMEVCFDLDAEDRFLSKVALGVGHMIFGDSFFSTGFAQTHQRILNERDPSIRESLPTLSINYTDSSASGALNDIAPLLAWPGGVLLAILPGRGGTRLVTNVYGRMSVTSVSDSNPPRGSEFDGGVVHVLVPQLGRHVGPIRFRDFVGHQHDRYLPELAELEALRVDPTSLPSLNEVSEEIQTSGPAF